jgi:hypothetical protein
MPAPFLPSARTTLLTLVGSLLPAAMSAERVGPLSHEHAKLGPGPCSTPPQPAVKHAPAATRMQIRANFLTISRSLSNSEAILIRHFPNGLILTDISQITFR